MRLARLFLISLTIVFSLIRSVSAQQAIPIQVIEAEQSAIQCAAGSQAHPTIWASNGAITPAFWGRAVGDRIQFNVTIEQTMTSPRLGIRYSFAEGDYLHYANIKESPRALTLTVDNNDPVEVHVPDTGWWDLFKTIFIDLPKLDKGEHTFTLQSPAEHSTTNIDCFFVMPDQGGILPPAMQSTALARSENQRFEIRATPGVKLNMPPDKLFKHFGRIYEHYKQYMGWAPKTPILIHLIEEARWDNPGATSYQNQWGVFFRAEIMPTEQGNWCHEMTHLFYEAHFPWWFDESSIRMLTTFDWAPTLFPQHEKPMDNPYYRQCVERGRAVLENPNNKFESVDDIQYALRMKFGPDLFKKFFHLCYDAGKEGKLDFTPGRHMTKAELMKYMSLAAGEDVTPYYQQWTGYDNAP